MLARHRITTAKPWQARTAALVALAAFVALVLPGPALALLKAHDEPPFTKPAYLGSLLPGFGFRNTWWFRTEVVSPGQPPERYCFTLKEGSADVKDLGCEQNDGGVRDFARVAYGLAIGHTYWVYVAKYVWSGGSSWIFYPQSTYFGNVTTTMDNSSPVLSCVLTVVPISRATQSCRSISDTPIPCRRRGRRRICALMRAWRVHHF